MYLRHMAREDNCITETCVFCLIGFAVITLSAGKVLNFNDV